jgi:UDP-N-acetylmuramoyl-L-alanyl-D-glutamate--2,6-diaminopimelate ligase
MNPKKMVRKVLPRAGIKLAEESYRKGRVYAMQAANGFPARGLRVIAVTGTNGKTTTCCYINQMLKTAGFKTAMYTTALSEMDGRVEPNRTHRTVLHTASLLRFFGEAKRAKVDFVVLELTSQALHQHKTTGVPIEISVMTNLTQDHLDYHKTMSAYAAAKARLFNKYMKPKYVVLNRDDEWFEYFYKQSVGGRVSYGEHPDSTTHISEVRLAADGSDWKLEQCQLRTHLPGRFNVQNASAAASVGMLLGLKPTQIEKGIAALPAVPGRMEQVKAGQPFTVVVDYAHTPDALENVLTAARQIAKGKVIAVFGATGDRDAAKRPIMGEVVGRTADMVFLTDDETYTEDSEAIRAAVRPGLKKAKSSFTEIADRKEAIKAAFKIAKKGDVVVLAGLGHQDTRNMGGKLIAWDERKMAKRLLTNS